ncbi:MAG: DNA methylase N-4 [Clostridia bacterium]|nr:DNA methylase N-4 [Clostridia bacterium]
MNTYDNFLKSKAISAPSSGFDVPLSEINDNLKPHQKIAVQWAVKGGRRALFEAFGLGKTAQQLEYCRLVTEHTGGRALIVLPLGVKQEFTEDAVNLLGLDRPPYIKSQAESDATDAKILITNYERVRDGDIDPRSFVCCCLDEASVLRSFGSKTYQTFVDKFRGVPYKLVATATPDPNKYKELIHYAGFLEIMDTGQALTRFFQRDSTKANNLTIYPHKEEEFWLWISTWAFFLSTPADLGFDAEGYELPPLDIRYHCVKDMSSPTFDRDGQMQMFRDVSAGLTEAAREKRESIDARADKMLEIVKSDPEAHFILWHDLEDERHAIKKRIPSVTEIYGAQDIDLKEKHVIDFAHGRIKYLATKKEISGQGCNFQRHCHRAIFMGIDYKFNDFIQAIHRIYRFLQKEKVIIDIIYTENETSVLRELQEKWKRHDEQTEKMREIVKKYGIYTEKLVEKMQRSIGVKRVEVKGEFFTAVNNDCILETRKMETDSVGLIHTSIPFSNHYEYTPSYNDFGHNEDNDKFFEQMDYLTPELLRVLKPGRVAAVHVKDRVLFGNATGDGMPTIDPFSSMTEFHFMKHGFRFMGRITVTTDVVRENNQTYRLGWSEQCKDGSKMGVGCPEYVLLFRKLPSDTSKAYADEPVTKSKEEYTRAQWQIDAHAFWKTSGDRLVTKDELMEADVTKLQKLYTKYSRDNVYNYKEHVELAKKLDGEGKLPATFMVVAPASWSDMVWDDINRMRTLNSTQARRKLQMHVCPLQLDIVERIINRYSNEGDLVYDPFGGLMTVPMTAVKMGRRGYGCELNPDYFRDGVGYLKAAEDEMETPTLFDILEGE